MLQLSAYLSQVCSQEMSCSYKLKEFLCKLDSNILKTFFALSLYFCSALGHDSWVVRRTLRLQADDTGPGNI